MQRTFVRALGGWGRQAQRLASHPTASASKYHGSPWSSARQLAPLTQQLMPRMMATKAKNKKTKQAPLEDALKQVESMYGKGAIMQLGSKEVLDVETISSGSLTLDLALGVGGFPKGRIVEIYGGESSGKTTLALHAIAEVQKSGGNCCFIDVEHALDPRYAADVGVDIDKLYIAQPDAGEQALEIADIMVRSGSMDLVVVDSVAALVPRAEAEGEMGDSHIALQARLMSQALRKITASLGSTHSKCILIFINQIRTKVGVMFGNPNVTSGGNALRFYSSVRLEVRKSTPLKDSDQIVGHTTVCKVVKNKVAPPLRTATFDMIFGQGISTEGELLDEGVRLGVVQRSGAWYKLNLSPDLSNEGQQGGDLATLNDTPFAQGREKAKTYLQEHPEVAAQLEAQIRELSKPARRDGAESKETDAAQAAEPESAQE